MLVLVRDKTSFYERNFASILHIGNQGPLAFKDLSPMGTVWFSLRDSTAGRGRGGGGGERGGPRA